MTAKKGRICSIGLGGFFYFGLLAQTISVYPISAIIKHFMLGPLITFFLMFLFLNIFPGKKKVISQNHESVSIFQLCLQVLCPVIVGIIGLILLNGKGAYPEISDLDWIALSIVMFTGSDMTDLIKGRSSSHKSVRAE